MLADVLCTLSRIWRIEGGTSFSGLMEWLLASEEFPLLTGPTRFCVRIP